MVTMCLLVEYWSDFVANTSCCLVVALASIPHPHPTLRIPDPMARSKTAKVTTGGPQARPQLTDTQKAARQEKNKKLTSALSDTVKGLFGSVRSIAKEYGRYVTHSSMSRPVFTYHTFSVGPSPGRRHSYLWAGNFSVSDVHRVPGMGSSRQSWQRLTAVCESVTTSFTSVRVTRHRTAPWKKVEASRLHEAVLGVSQD